MVTKMVKKISKVVEEEGEGEEEVVVEAEEEVVVEAEENAKEAEDAVDVN